MPTLSFHMNWQSKDTSMVRGQNDACYGNVAVNN